MSNIIHILNFCLFFSIFVFLSKLVEIVRPELRNSLCYIKANVLIIIVCRATKNRIGSLYKRTDNSKNIDLNSPNFPKMASNLLLSINMFFAISTWLSWGFFFWLYNGPIFHNICWTCCLLFSTFPTSLTEAPGPKCWEPLSLHYLDRINLKLHSI